MTTETELLTTEEAARLLKMAEATLEKWRSKGGGPRFVRVGRAVRYLRADLINWVGSRTYSHTTEARAAA